jgi:hypothetical protein
MASGWAVEVVERDREGQVSWLVGEGKVAARFRHVLQDMNICMCLSNSSLQALEDKEERVLLQYNSTRYK